MERHDFVLKVMDFTTAFVIKKLAKKFQTLPNLVTLGCRRHLNGDV